MRFKLKTVIGAGALGAAVMWLYDPDQGARRRHRLQDVLRSRANRAEREVERKLRHERGRLEGMVHRFSHPQHGPPADDRTLVDQIKSEVLGKERFTNHDVLVEANEGVVVLRGQVDDPVVRVELESTIEQMPGVQRVESYLHAPGEEAPNKAEALHATG